MACPESSTSRQRTLTKEGSAYLTNYARTVNSYPRRAEKLSILDTVRAIPGNENFTFEKLTQWFARHRNPAHARPANFPRPAHLPALPIDPHSTVLIDDETILFPKLTPTHLQQLRVLYKKRPSPTEGIITFWAERLNAERAEVEAWIQYQQEKAKENDHASATPDSPEIPLRQLMGDLTGNASESPTESDFRKPHLPTPAKSLSPSISPHTRMLSLPPIAVKEEDSKVSLSPVVMFGKPSTVFQQKPVAYTQHRSVLEGLPPLTRLVQDSSVSRQQAKPFPVGVQVPITALHVGEHTPRQLSGMRATASLAACIKDGIRSNNHANEPPPTTADEFASKFQRIEDQINAFMKAFDDGKLAPLGWDSSLNKAILSEI